MPIKEDAASIIRPRTFYAHFGGGGGTLAQYDDTGTWLADMETGLAGDAWGCIKEDTAANVNDGAIMATSSGDIKVYDWNKTGGMTTYTYSPAATWKVTPPIWTGGYVQWAQIKTAVGGVRDVLWRRANADLTSVATVQSSTASGFGATYSGSPHDVLAIVPDNMWMMAYKDALAQVVISIRLRAATNSWDALVGSGDEFVTLPSISEGDFVEAIIMPMESGDAIGLAVSSNGEIEVKDVPATVDPVDAERIAESGSFTVQAGDSGNMDTNRNEQVALSYAKGGESGEAWVYLGDQTEGIQFEDHPTLSTSPDKVFFAED